MLQSELYAPYVEEELLLKYSEEAMLKNLGEIQSNLKLMNLIEIYTIILIVVCALIGGVSLAVSTKFVKYFRREQLGTNLKSTMINGVDMDEHESVKDYAD